MGMHGTASQLADTLIDRTDNGERFIVALAGPPGVGKSTFSESLVGQLQQRGHCAAIVPMDGFHLDNAVLEARGTLARKGAPFTFDVDGYAALLKRLRAHPDIDIAVPVFDRKLDLARAGGRIISNKDRFLIAEGNYLLLDEAPWRGMAGLFDFTVMLTADINELRKRLVGRWLAHGLDEKAAITRAMSNDIPNAELVINNSRPADLKIATDA